MNIGVMSMKMNQSALKTAVQLSVMKLQMNQNSDQSEGMKRMMETMAVDPNLGQRIDTKA